MQPNTRIDFYKLILVKLTESTIYRLIWNQLKISLVPNQSENGKYSLISVILTRNRNLLCV